MTSNSQIAKDTSISTLYHIVSIPKFLLMINLTLGFYSFYWYYRQWLLHRGQRGLKPIALLCGMAGPLLLYPLMKRITQRSREAGLAVEGSPLGVALMFWMPYLILAAWALTVPNRPPAGMPHSLFLLMPAVLMVVCWIVPLVAMALLQQAANVYAGDDLGRTNAQITWANGLWVIVSWLPMAVLMALVAKRIG